MNIFSWLTLRLFYIVAFSLGSCCPVFAQVVPDNTLGAESSTIRSIDDLKNAVEGGAIRGENLFHSFEQFAIQEGFTTEFNNPEGIANIFSRVTGGNISEILGTIAVDGGANLFLMNPNGVDSGQSFQRYNIDLFEYQGYKKLLN